MKIGEFSKRNKISKDTIRHYTDLGLLFPLKKGAHYEFDDQTEKELEAILSFKNMGFSLQEIKKILDFKRIGKLSHYQAAEYYNQFFKNKFNQIQKEIQSLEATRDQLNAKINELSDYLPKELHKFGIDLSTLPNLVCPKCKKQLALTTGNIIDHQILDGILACSCGESFDIQDGILVHSKQTKRHTNVDFDHLVHYIRETPSNYIDQLYKGGVWLDRNVDFTRLQTNTMLELGIGYGYFLRFIYDKLPDSAIYFAVDHDIGMLTLLKRLLERANVKKNIVFICSDFLDIPLADASVDTVIDFAGSSNYGFSHDHFLLDEVQSLFKKNSQLIGSYIIYNKFSRTSKIPTGLRPNFSKRLVTEKVNKLGFNINNQMSTDFLTNGGKYESYISEGEEVYTYFMIGMRD